MISKQVHGCFVEVQKQMASEQPIPNIANLQRQLAHLSFKDKEILCKQMIDVEWDVGGRRTFALLQSLNIISITEYLQNCKTPQLVMPDLLEAEFTLLSCLINYSHYMQPRTEVLQKILHECFKSVIDDIKTDDANFIYLRYLRNLVHPEPFTKMLQLHLVLLVESESHTTLDVMVRMHDWFEETIPSAMHSMLVEILYDDNCLETILELVIDPNFRGWKYFCVYLRVMSEVITDGKVLRLKTFVKQLFKQYLKTKSNELFQAFMMAGRLCCRSSPRKFGSYNEWYRKSIGEMNYIITKQQFLDVMDALQDMTLHETDIPILTVHEETAISTPPRFEYYVILYKQVCRKQIEEAEGKLDNIKSTDRKGTEPIRSQSKFNSK